MPSLANRLRRFAAEFCTALDAPPAQATRLHTVARVRLLLGLPVVYGPALLVLRDFQLGAAEPGRMLPVTMAWLALALAFVLLNAAALLVPVAARGTGAYRLLSVLVLASVVVEMACNQALMYAYGTLLHPGVALSVAVIAAYRTAVDYRTGLVAAVSASVLYAGVGLLEFQGVLPRHPAAPYPFAHPALDDPTIASAAVRLTVTSFLLAFCVSNYGANQSLKLHRYITESVLARYLPPALVARAADGVLELDGPPERRVVTVLFTDIVGFTRLSEQLGPELVGTLLNRYLGDIARRAHAHGATVDKFVGDAVMLVFGAPEPLPPAEQARRAAACAVDIHAWIETFTAGYPLEARTGIHTGEAVVGNFGSSVRSDYTVIGPAVNVAARLEAASKPGCVLLGETTADLLREHYELEDAGLLTLKNVSEPVRACFLGPAKPQARAL